MISTESVGLKLTITLQCESVALLTNMQWTMANT